MINSSKLRDKRFWNKWEESGAIGWAGMPPPCNPDIFQHGSTIAVLDARSAPAERWVRLVARWAEAQIDWHYSGGRAQVLHLGDAASRARVHATMRELDGRLKGKILQFYNEGEPGLYRAGVTTAPAGAIAAFADDDGRAAYMVA